MHHPMFTTVAPDLTGDAALSHRVSVYTTMKVMEMPLFLQVPQ